MTAVEYTIQEIEKLAGIKISRDEDCVIKANEMFEQQIEDAFYQTELDEFGDEVEFGQYYNETFKQQEQCK